MRSQIYQLHDLYEMAKERINNKFDFNIAVSGPRGNGKSTFLFKLFSKFKQFRPRNHLIYKRKDVMKLLEGNKYGVIMDDEAIRTGYKRNFFETDQKLLVQMLNMYRDNFNVYGMAIPNFYSLDKGLRDLIKMHIQIVERGVGVIHIAQSSLYSDDAWDVNYNKKIEERWGERKKKNPNFKPPYHKLSTFYGYVHFKDLTKAQRRVYENLKAKKRKEMYDDEMNQEVKKEASAYERMLDVILKGGVTKSMLIKLCVMNGLKYNIVVNRLNMMLKDRGIEETLSKFIINENVNNIHSNLNPPKIPQNLRLPVI